MKRPAPKHRAVNYARYGDDMVIVNGTWILNMESLNGCLKIYPDGTQHFIKNDRHD